MPHTSATHAVPHATTHAQGMAEHPVVHLGLEQNGAQNLPRGLVFGIGYEPLVLWNKILLQLQGNFIGLLQELGLLHGGMRPSAGMP